MTSRAERLGWSLMFTILAGIGLLSAIVACSALYAMVGPWAVIVLAGGGVAWAVIHAFMWSGDEDE